MHVSHIARSAFDRMVDLVACDRALSRDGSDQGIINSLAYGHGVFDNVTLLPFRCSQFPPRQLSSLSLARSLPAVCRRPPSRRYNAIHRVQMLRPNVWRRWDPSIVHIVGDRKPWSPAARLAAGTKCNRSKECLGNSPYFEQEREWLRACPAPSGALTSRT